MRKCRSEPTQTGEAATAEEQTDVVTGETRSKRKRHYMTALLASTALASAGPAYTQSDSDNQDDSRIEEIIVRGIARQYRPDDQTSATGLNMKLIDTPQAITVLSAEMLQTIGATDSYDATDLVPGMERSGIGFGSQQIMMRGVRLARQRINGALTTSLSITPNAYLVDRMEVVRGPATALYGVTGAFGGEVNNVLKGPKAQAGVEFSVEGEANYGSMDYKLDATGPLGGEGSAFRGRLVANYLDGELPYDISNEALIHEELNVMASLEWDITDQTQAKFWYVLSDRDLDSADGGGAVLRASDGALLLPSDVFDIDPDTWYFSHPDQSLEFFNTDLVNLELNHTFGNDWEGRLQLQWNHWDWDTAQFYTLGPFGNYGLPEDQTYIYSYDRFAEQDDLTFNASLGGDFEMGGREHSFFAAIEYADSLEPERVVLRPSVGVGVARYDIYADGVYDGDAAVFVDGSVYTPISREPIGVRAIGEEENTDFKASAMLLLNPSDQWSVLAGLLFQDTETTATSIDPAGVAPNNSTTTSFNEVRPRLGVTYNLTGDAKLYFSYSEGFNPQVFTDTNGNSVVVPEEMEQVEIGLKAEFFDGAVGAALAYYDAKIDNVATFTVGSGSQTIDAKVDGTRDTTGVELEVVGEILPGWNVAFNYAYTDTVLFSPGFNIGVGQRGVPKNSAALTTSYEFLDGPLNGLRIGGTLKVAGDYTLINSPRLANRYRRLDGSPGTLEAPGYERLDLNISYSGFTGSLEGLTLYGIFQNVTDEEIWATKSDDVGFGLVYIDRQLFKIGARFEF